MRELFAMLSSLIRYMIRKMVVSPLPAPKQIHLTLPFYSTNRTAPRNHQLLALSPSNASLYMTSRYFHDIIKPVLHPEILEAER